VRELVKAARARGEELTGPDGLLKSITKQVLESALEEEMTEHLGHEKHAIPATEGSNIRNGTRPKTVLTDAAGEVTIEVPRGPGRYLRTGHRQEAAAAPERCRRRSNLVVRQGVDHR
jgi:transposase-like protein